MTQQKTLSQTIIKGIFVTLLFLVPPHIFAEDNEILTPEQVEAIEDQESPVKWAKKITDMLHAGEIDKLVALTATDFPVTDANEKKVHFESVTKRYFREGRVPVGYQFLPNIKEGEYRVKVFLGSTNVNKQIVLVKVGESWKIKEM